MYPRFIERQLRQALSDTRVVLITGPRQAGKTTLAEKLARDDMPFLTLDDETTLDTALRDPVGFVRGLDRAIVDEVQRAPRLLLAIKRSVDIDKRPGRFVLTGSANLMSLPQAADSLAGRMALAELLPLSQGDCATSPAAFSIAFSKARRPQSARSSSAPSWSEPYCREVIRKCWSVPPGRADRNGFWTTSKPSSSATCVTSPK